MAQFFFSSLFMVALFTGAYVYVAPNKPIDPIGFITEKSGFKAWELSNRKRMAQLNVKMSQGLIKIHGHLEDIAIIQNSFRDTLEAQQEVLKNTTVNAENLMQQAQKKGGIGNRDVLQFKSLGADLDNEQQLLIVRGQNLIRLNDELTQSRERIAEQLDLARESRGLQSGFSEQYSIFNNRAAVFFNKVQAHNHSVNDLLNRIQDRLQTIQPVQNIQPVPTIRAVPGIAPVPMVQPVPAIQPAQTLSPRAGNIYQANVNDAMARLLDREGADMRKLADSEAKSQYFWQIAKVGLADAKLRFDDAQQRLRELMAREKPIETISHHTAQHAHVMTSKGITQIRQQVDDLALEQDRFLDTLQSQQQILKETAKTASNLVHKLPAEYGVDILQFHALGSQMEDQGHLLMARGADLIAFNDELVRSRRLIADQLDYAKVNTETSFSALQRRYVLLNHRALGLFHNVTVFNESVRAHVGNIHGQLHSMINNVIHHNGTQQQSIEIKIRHMLEKEREDMSRLADSERRFRDFLQDARERQADAKELMDERRQQNQDLIQQEHQKQEEQQMMVQQHVADQRQWMQDMQNGRGTY